MNANVHDNQTRNRPQTGCTCELCVPVLGAAGLRVKPTDETEASLTHLMETHFSKVRHLFDDLQALAVQAS